MAKRLKAIDLNLFFVMSALYRHRNVTHASRELRVSQSAISHSLAKLRTHFGDPMFVRVAGGVEPTKLALSLESDVLAVIEKAREITDRNESSEIAQASGTLIIYTTDLFETLFGAEIWNRLRNEAPKVNLIFRSASGTFPKEILERGECDIAIGGYLKSLPAGFYKQRLFEDDYVVCLRKNHPLGRAPLTEERYFEMEHARMTLIGSLADEHGRMLKGHRVTRALRYGSGQFSGLFHLISKTDLILTAPRHLAEFYQPLLALQIYECPIQIAPLKIDMSWHGLTQTDPLRKWARQLIRDVSQFRTGT